MNQKKIGQLIKQLRKEKGLTQEQLSEILGVTSRSVSRWENGVNLPDFDLVIEAANYFDVTIYEFLDGERKENKIDKKENEALLKVSDYNSIEKIKVKKLPTCTMQFVNRRLHCRILYKTHNLT